MRRPPRRLLRPRWAAALLAGAAIGCSPSLPEPESAGATLYEARCATCHRLYPPNVMTTAMWDLMLQRMQGEMRRRGVAPLDSRESKVLLDYLSRHALDAGGPNDES